MNSKLKELNLAGEAVSLQPASRPRLARADLRGNHIKIKKSNAITKLGNETSKRSRHGPIPVFHIFTETRKTILITNSACCSAIIAVTLSLIFSYHLEPIRGSRVSNNRLQSDRVDCEIIEPIFRAEGQGEHLSVDGCPQELDLLLQTSYSEDELLIHLVKNQRLISDRYFRTMKERSDNSRTSADVHGGAPSTEKSTTKKLASISRDQNSRETQDQFLLMNNFTSNDNHCHYHGFINNNLKSISAISIVNFKLLSGLVNIGTKSFYLIADESRSSTIITKPTAIVPGENDWSTCKHFSRARMRLRRQVDSLKRRRFLKTNPDNKVLHDTFQSNSSSLFVELLVVHDHSQYLDNNKNASLIAERTMQIVNIMNAFYRQLNIFVALVGVVLWTEKDEIQLTEDGDATLTNFLKYRYEKLLPKYHHDNAQLITSTSFNGSVVGKALKGPICTHDHSGGVNTDHSHNPAIVAVTLAHELGHNLGMEHDEDTKCKCPDEKCIMSSSSSFVHPKHWSSCSIEYLEDSRKHGLLDCLLNAPIQIFGPVCGNGFVEEGEDCDIGEPIPSYGTSKSRSNKNRVRSSNGAMILESDLAQRNPCCDRLTCKFTTNSTCAQGQCCDLTRCSVFSANEAKICRPRKTECDIEEACDGSSEYCPRDVYYHDGIECGPSASAADGQVPTVESATYNRSRAFCYQGRCSSHESQCQLLWGPTGTTSKDICYEQNIHGNTSGNCGYNRADKTFDSCEMDNAACGMLHCVHNQISLSDPNRKTGKLNFGFESASILTVSFFVMSNHAKIYCHGAIMDAGPGMRDPGLVPNGAACGDDRMCVNQKCVPVQDVLHQDWCPSDCNGNGICDNMGVCHCNDGTIGSSCYQFFGPHFHLSLILYMIMFFGPIIAIIVLATNHYQTQIKMWWFLHNRKIVWRNKAREPNQQRGLAYDVNGRNMSIGEPIPLNQQSTANGTFIDPTDLDPWAETSYRPEANGKSLGYRLEPIKSKPPPPPPLPDYHNSHHRLPPAPSEDLTVSSAIPSRGGEKLKPVRSAPPPPIPPHRR